MIFQSLKMAWKSIASNKMRSFLTMLGIIIGVFALVVLVSLAKGATSSVNESVAGLGSNLLSVSVSDDKGKPLTISDLDSLTKSSDISEVAPIVQTSVTYSVGSKDDTISLFGTTGSFFSIEHLELDSGRLLKSVDNDNHVNVVVLTYEAATELLGSSNVVGQTIKLDGMDFEVVGVLQKQSSSVLTGTNYRAYVPFNSLIRCGTGLSAHVTNFYVSATDSKTMDKAESIVNSFLLNRFEQDSDAFTVTSQSQLMETMNKINSTLSLLLGGIAGISLLVGGIGIMNIMLVSVTERTREIGIRKAVGAGRGTILMQFLIEAFLLSLIGCLFGLLLSWIAIHVIDTVGSVNYGLSGSVAALAVAFSLFVGLVFGFYPANKAAKKCPIDALRYTA